MPGAPWKAGVRALISCQCTVVDRARCSEDGAKAPGDRVDVFTGLLTGRDLRAGTYLGSLASAARSGKK